MEYSLEPFFRTTFLITSHGLFQLLVTLLLNITKYFLEYTVELLSNFKGATFAYEVVATNRDFYTQTIRD